MTYSEISPILIYEKREDLTAFSVDDDDCINGAMYERLLNLRCLQLPYSEMRKQILSIFNDVYYICTMLFEEYRPSEHLGQYLSIARNTDSNITESEREAAVMSMIHCILWSCGVQNGIPIWVKLLLDKIDNVLNGYVKGNPDYIVYSTMTKDFDFKRYEVNKSMFRKRSPQYILPMLSSEFWEKETDNYFLGTIVELAIRIGNTIEDKNSFLNSIRHLVLFHFEKEFQDFGPQMSKEFIDSDMQLFDLLYDDPKLIASPIPKDRIVMLKPKDEIAKPKIQGDSSKYIQQKKTATTATFTYENYCEDNFSQQRLELIARKLIGQFVAGTTHKSLIEDLFTGIDIEVKSKIIWKGTKAELVYFFKQLNAKNRIKWPKDEMMWVIVASHFKIKTELKSQGFKEVPISADSLQSYTGKPKKEMMRLLDNIIKLFDPDLLKAIGITPIETEDEAEKDKYEKLALYQFLMNQKR